MVGIQYLDNYVVIYFIIMGNMNACMCVSSFLARYILSVGMLHNEAFVVLQL